ncbi:MAG: permease prefix domain 1-containing protein [Phycisphaerales bacterium]
MTHLSKDNPNPEPPVSRDGPAPHDGVDSWLDVLTSMLSLPASQRAQVRDELEDHLRSRVDDLLIAGKPEPEAIRTAIAELGETAQLARHITSANRTPKSFRRFAMNATFFVLAGSILTAGVSMMMPSAPQQQTSNTGSESVVAIDKEPSDESSFDSFTVDVRDATVAEFIQQIDRNIERPLIVHWELISDLGFNRDAPLDIDADPIPAGLALTILAERTEPTLSDSIAVLEKDDRIEIGTRSQFDRRTSEKRIYDLSIFTPEAQVIMRGNQMHRSAPRVSTENEMTRIRGLLQSHISSDAWVDFGGDIASATVLNTTLVVSAPVRMHTQIDALLGKLIEQHIAQLQEKEAHQQRMIERASGEFSQVRDSLMSVRMELLEKQEELKRVGISPFNDTADPEARAEAEKRSLEVQAQQEDLKLKERELLTRHDHLQSIIIQSEYEELTALID